MAATAVVAAAFAVIEAMAMARTFTKLPVAIAV